MQTSSSESMQYIVDSILDYIDRDKTNHAILLNGKWGSGKTYFWENVLKEKIEAKEKQNKGIWRFKKEVDVKKRNAIYVSLYGVNSIEEINKKIFLGKWEKLQKITGSKIGGGVSEIAKAMLGSVKNMELPYIKGIEVPNIDFGQFLNFTDTVLCFDDLERASIDINEILGYINNFVEHDGVKVILIANENEIEAKLNDKNLELKILTTCFYTDMEDESNSNTNLNSNSKKEEIPKNELITRNLKDLFQNKNEYKRIKEKLIGKTLTLQLDEKVLIEDIVVQTSNKKQDLQKFFEDNLVTIEDTYRESDSKNIRILKQALEDFDLIYQNCKECGYKSDAMLRSILKFVLAASYEIKTSIQNNEELEIINSHKDFIDATGLSGMLGGKAMEFPKKFKNKYYNGQNLFYQRAFFKFAEVLIRKGIFNKELFKGEMDSFKLELKEINIKDPHIEFINGNFWYVTDDEFEVLERNTYNKLKKGEIHFTWYFRAYQTYEFFRRKGIISIGKLDLKQELMEGLKKAGERGPYIEYTFTMFLMVELSNEENLAEEDLYEFKEMIKEINDDLEVKKEKEDAQFLFELMRTDFNSFSRKMNENQLHINIPFFAHCEPEEFCATIVNLSADNIKNIRGFIRNRIDYVDENHYSYLQTELPNLKKIKCRLNTEIKSRKMTPRLVHLMWLVEDIDKFEDKVKTFNNTVQ
ncbi:P-loop NTPase fold protein [Bacillus paramobilis]|uniref:P-loop NTPase fold protein n=1 Tax=Bacillus paramobilis TaxID=2817477 RepID=UPI003D1A3439